MYYFNISLFSLTVFSGLFRILGLISNKNPADDESDEESYIHDQLDLLRSGDQADVTLICEDKNFMVHTHIIGARSDVFRAMFFDLKRDRVLRIENLSVNTLDILLHYFYSGKAPEMTIETALKVHRAANTYAVDHLEKICERVIKKKIREANAASILTYAALEDSPELKDIAVTYLAGRKNYLLSESWRRFCDNHPKLANDVFLAFVRRA